MKDFDLSQITPVAIAVGATLALLIGFIAIMAGYLGRALAKTRFSRAGEMLLRLSVDLRGLLEAFRQPAGTPSVSAQPVAEATAAIVQSPAGPTVAPPPMPPKEPPTTPLNGPLPPPAGTPRDGSSVLRLAEAGRHLGVLSLLLLSGCTRLERAEVAADVEPYVEASKPLCKLVADQVGSPFVEYLCTAASAIPGILRGMSTEDRLDASRPTASGRIKVARENRETFERFFVQP